MICLKSNVNGFGRAYHPILGCDIDWTCDWTVLIFEVMQLPEQAWGAIATVSKSSMLIHFFTLVSMWDVLSGRILSPSDCE